MNRQEHQEKRVTIGDRLGQACLLFLAGWLWLAERIYRPLIERVEQDPTDTDTLCYLIDCEGGEGCL